MTILILAAILSLAVGAVLGMLGGGGAILTLPLLVYAVHVEPRAAIATSLFVVGATSLVGSAIHARAGAVRWSIAAIFGGAAMAGAFGGGRLARHVPAQVLLVLFAVIMLVTATAMLRGRAAPEGGPPRPLALGRALALGATVGVLSGLVGAGGGFLIVPALTLFGGLAIREAIGTSLVVIALQSFAGFAGQAGTVPLDWTLIAVVTSAAVAGAIGGARIGKKVPASVLRRGFAWLVLAMGLFVIGKQTPLAVTILASALTLLAVLFVTRTKPRGIKENPCTTSRLSPH